MKGFHIMLIATPIFCLLFALAGAAKHNEPAPKPTPVNPTPPPHPPCPPIPPVPSPPPAPRPGSGVVWTEYKAVKNLGDPSWGDYLTDIENHLPEKFGRQYRFEDKNTWAHETTHGIIGHLNNEWSKLNERGVRDKYWLYVGHDRACGIPEPGFKISDISKMVPAKMRQDRFQLYLVQQRKYFENEPVYLFDEWVAYCNGAECGNELAAKNLRQLSGKNDEVFAVLEFGVYASYVAIAQKKYDPEYDNKQLLEFLAWNLERSMKLYREGYKHDNFNWDNNKYLEFLKSSQDAAEWRSFLIEAYGSDWTKEVFGFDKK